MERYGLIPDYQFSFRSKHATIEQKIHKIVKRMNSDMKAQKLHSGLPRYPAGFRQDLTSKITL